jgi:hypothetical protein
MLTKNMCMMYGFCCCHSIIVQLLKQKAKQTVTDDSKPILSLEDLYKVGGVTFFLLMSKAHIAILDDQDMERKQKCMAKIVK